MTVQTRITKLEFKLNTRFADDMRKTDKPIVFYALMLQGNFKKGSVPYDKKITHADWDRYHADIIRREFEFGEKVFTEQLNLCFEIKDIIDDFGGWKD